MLSLEPLKKENDWPKNGRRCFAVMNSNGDDKGSYDPLDPVEAAKAQAVFDAIIKSGATAYDVTQKAEGGAEGTQIRDFKEVSERTLFAPRMVGG